MVNSQIAVIDQDIEEKFLSHFYNNIALFRNKITQCTMFMHTYIYHHIDPPPSRQRLFFSPSPSVSQSVSQSVYQSVYQSVSLSVSLSVCRSARGRQR
jgi:hypothetical protein